MAGTAKKTNTALWNKVKDKVTHGDRGGKPDQWSARKAQLAVQEYKKQGGGYASAKDPDNHLQQWTKEDWGTKSGNESGKTGERYLPKRAREHLTDKEYAATTAKKRKDTEHGKQFSPQPRNIAKKTAHDRGTGSGGQSASMAMKRTELLAQAADRGITGRSRMSKEQLIQALR